MVKQAMKSVKSDKVCTHAPSYSVSHFPRTCHSRGRHSVGYWTRGSSGSSISPTSRMVTRVRRIRGGCLRWRLQTVSFRAVGRRSKRCVGGMPRTSYRHYPRRLFGIQAIAVIDSTEKWGARVVYGDTDSVFIYLKGKTKKQAFKTGYEIADTVTAMNPAPIKLKFEKVSVMLVPTLERDSRRARCTCHASSWRRRDMSGSNTRRPTKPNLPLMPKASKPCDATVYRLRRK